MKIFLISDNVDTLTGMRLAGVSGAVAHTREELRDCLGRVINDSETGIVLIMEGLAKKFPETVREIKLNMTRPLLVEIPDRHGTGRGADFIEVYIREAIGVKI